MEKRAPEYQNNNWIWWSVGAILLTAVLTIVLVGSLTGNWPWNRSNAAPEGTTPNQTVGTTVPTEDATVPEDTTEPADTTVPEGTTEPEETTDATTAPTEPTKPAPTEPTKPAPTEPSEPEETQPEETEPEQTQPTTKPTEPEEDEDEGGGEKPQPGDIDVPIGPRP